MALLATSFHHTVTKRRSWAEREKGKSVHIRFVYYHHRRRLFFGGFGIPENRKKGKRQTGVKYCRTLFLTHFNFTSYMWLVLKSLNPSFDINSRYVAWLWRLETILWWYTRTPTDDVIRRKWTWLKLHIGTYCTVLDFNTSRAMYIMVSFNERPLMNLKVCLLCSLSGFCFLILKIDFTFLCTYIVKDSKSLYGKTVWRFESCCGKVRIAWSRWDFTRCFLYSDLLVLQL